MSKRYLWVAGIVVVALAAVGLFVALQSRDASERPTSKLPEATTTQTAPPVPGIAASATEAPKVTDIPTPPAGLAKKVAEKGLNSLSAEERAAWQRYLDETAAVVVDNSASFETTVRAALTAIMGGKAADLHGMYAADEHVELAFAQAVVDAYPTISASGVQRSVGVFSVARSTVYFGYSVVRWEDAGITSEHTLAVPLRFISGKWYLTSIGSGTRGLEFVQGIEF